MKSIYFLFVIFFFSYSLHSFAQQTSGEKEKMLDQLIKSGYLRKEGNLLIFKVKKASDTPQIKLMYGALFGTKEYTIAFDVDGQYFKRNNQPAPGPQQKKPTTINDCIKDFNTITAERFIVSGKIKLQGNLMRYSYSLPADTNHFKTLYPCKVRYKNIVYDVVFRKENVPGRNDSLVAGPLTIGLPTARIVQFQFLKNPDFEMGFPVPHWRKQGEAFKEPHEVQNQLTWKDMKVVSVRGDYWKDLDYPRGYHAKSWVTSLKEVYGLEWERRRLSGGTATGSLTSEPFKLYSFQKIYKLSNCRGKG
ncbi:MAG: hypothetical protein ACKVOW_12200 [Chitinophagaceae bacterium]